MLKLPEAHRWFVEPLDSETNSAIGHMLADKGEVERHGHYRVEGKKIPLWEITEDELNLIISNAFNTFRIYHIKKHGGDIERFETGILYKFKDKRRPSKTVLVVWNGVHYQKADKIIRGHNLNSREEFWHRYTRENHRQYIRKLKNGNFSKILILGNGKFFEDHEQLIKTAQEHGVPVETRNDKARMFVAKCAMGHAA